MERRRATLGAYRAARQSEPMSARGVIDQAMRAYYEQRAAEYDDWWLGRGIFARRERPGWHDEVATVLDAVRALEPARVLDVACGTAFVTRHLRGDVTGLDQSEAMVRIAGAPEEWQERKLNDGSRHLVYKRFFTPDGLAAELGAGRVLHAGQWFVMVAARG